LVDRANLEYWAKEIASHECAHDTYNDIGNQALTTIRPHDDAGYPADQCPGDNPYNEVDHFLS
jgi:hypothetical protein